MYILYALLITLILLWSALILDFYEATYHLIRLLDKTEEFFNDIPACFTEMTEK